MAVTYQLIASSVLGSATNTVTFSSIPATYNNLIIKASTRSSGSGGVFVRFNGDSTSLYSQTRLRQNGSTVSAGRSSNQTEMYLGLDEDTLSLADTFTSWEFVVPEYLSTSYKAIVSMISTENNQTINYIYKDANAGLYRNSSALTSITMLKTSDDFVAGSSFFLYGIKNS